MSARPRPRASPTHSARHSLSTVAIPGWSGSLISPVLGRVSCAQSAPLDANTECQGADRDQRHPNPTRSPRTFRAWELSDSPPPASPHQLRDVRQPSVPRRRRHRCPLPGPRTLSAPSTAATVSCLEQYRLPPERLWLLPAGPCLSACFPCLTPSTGFQHQPRIRIRRPTRIRPAHAIRAAHGDSSSLTVTTPTLATLTFKFTLSAHVNTLWPSIAFRKNCRLWGNNPPRLCKLYCLRSPRQAHPVMCLHTPKSTLAVKAERAREMP